MTNNKMKLILMLMSIYLLCIEYSIKFSHASSLKANRNQCKWVVSNANGDEGGVGDDGDGAGIDETVDDENTNINLLSCELHTFNESFNIINDFYNKSKLKFTNNNKFKNFLQIKCINNNNNNNNSSGVSSIKAFNLNHIKQFNYMLDELYIENCKLILINENEFSQFQKLFKLSLNNYHRIEFHQKSFTGLRNLFELNLSNNHIKLLPENLFYNLNHLKILNISQNHLENLTNLSMDFNNNLEVLDLSHNRLNKLAINDLNTLKRLSVLHLQHNKLHKVDEYALMELKNLQIIYLANNRIDKLTSNFFRDNINLLQINLKNNHLKYLDETMFDSLSNLELIDLSQNNLTSNVIKGKLFARLTKLVSLNLGSNQLTTIDIHLFKNLADLKILNLENNNIRDINANIFASLTNLIDLNMNGNKLEYIPKGLGSLVALKSLDLGKNHIKSINRHDFNGLKNLLGLRMVDNQIENITSDSLTPLQSLHILNLASNHISRIERNAFSGNALHAIRLDNNKIDDISTIFASLQQLVWLNISDNKIENFDLKYLPTTLEWLDMHKNHIKLIKNSYKQNQQQQYLYDDEQQQLYEQLDIKYIDASFNKIEVINEHSIPANIEIFYLNNNNINRIATGTFLNKIYLKKVHLQHNLLETFEKNALLLYTNKNYYLNNDENFELYSSKNVATNDDASNFDQPEFYLQYNPFKCDCQMDWLKTVNLFNKNSQSRYPKIVDLNDIKCYKSHNHLLLGGGQTVSNSGRSGSGNGTMGQYKLNDVKKDEFLCPYEKHCFPICHCCQYDFCNCEMVCPISCTCYSDNLWQNNIVDCGNKNFSLIPKQIPMDATKIYLDGNNLQRFHEKSYFVGKKKLMELYLNNSNIEQLTNTSFLDLQPLKVLHLEYNRLKTIAGDEFSELINLEKLFLNNNQLTKIASATFHHMEQLKLLNVAYNNLRTIDFVLENPIHKTITIERDHFVGNLWYCNCRFLHEHRNYETTINQICHPENFRNCKNGINVIGDGNGVGGNGEGDKSEINEIINFIDKREFIKEIINTKYMQLIGAVLVALIGTAVIITLVFIFRNNFTLWAYTKYGIRLKKVPASDADFDDSKLYDCFLFYSYHDYDLVQRVINFQLEKYGYCTCLQHRYGNQIFSTSLFNESVELSKKLLLILTPNFLQYEWSNMNFRLALKTLIFKINKSQRQYKIILIVAVPVDLLLLDPILDILIKTSTTLFWGEKNFWNKLKYAMPDVVAKKSNIASNTSTNKKNKNKKNTLSHHPFNQHQPLTIEHSVQHHYIPTSQVNSAVENHNDDYEDDEDFVINNFVDDETRTINILSKDESMKKHSFSRELPNNRYGNAVGGGGNGTIKLLGNGVGSVATTTMTGNIIDIETGKANSNDSNEQNTATGHIYNTISEIQTSSAPTNNPTANNPNSNSSHPLVHRQKAYFV